MTIFRGWIIVNKLIQINLLAAMKKVTYSVAKISGFINKKRMAAGLTRDELARKAKVNYNTVIKLESGANKNPTIQTLIGISKILGVHVEDFIK